MEKTEGVAKNRQSRYTGNIGHKTHSEEEIKVHGEYHPPAQVSDKFIPYTLIPGS